MIDDIFATGEAEIKRPTSGTSVVFENGYVTTQRDPPMPWRLQIASMLAAGYVSNPNVGPKIFIDKDFLDAADRLIKAHEETKK